MKPFNDLAQEEILQEGMKAVPEYLSDIRQTRVFSLEDCLGRCLKRVRECYQRSVETGQSARIGRAWFCRPLTRERTEELDRVLAQIREPLRERLVPVEQRYLREQAASRINAASATAIIRSAFREAGLSPSVTGQKYRARVEVAFPDRNCIRFYVPYKDIAREGYADELLKAVLDLANAFSRLGYGAAINRK